MTSRKQAVSDAGGNAAVARRLGVSEQTLSNWMNRGIPIEYCARFEEATEGRWRRSQERPDDWRLIWPELAGRDSARLSASACALVLYGPEGGEGCATLAIDLSAPGSAPGCELVLHDRDSDGRLPAIPQLPFHELHIGDELRVRVMEGTPVLHVFPGEQPLGLRKPGDADAVQFSQPRSS